MPGAVAGPCDTAANRLQHPARQRVEGLYLASAAVAAGAGVRGACQPSGPIAS